MSKFIVVPTEILADERLSPTAKLVCGMIITLSNQRGYCYANNQYFSNALGQSKTTIQRAMKELEEHSVIDRIVSKEDGNKREIRANKNYKILASKMEYPNPENEVTLTPNMTLPNPKNDTHNIKDNKKKNNILRDEKFEEFWNLYNKKVGKQKAKDQWSKINESEYDTIIERVKKYLVLRPDAVYRKDPERFLKHKVYDDDILIEQQASQEQQGTHSFEIQIPNVC